MLNREEMKVLIEREGISEFFNVIDCVYSEDAECTVYELDTDYYAVMFRIFPPAYSGEGTEEMISSAITCGLPIDSVVQFHQICSRNLSDHLAGYDNVIVDDVESLDLENPKMLKSLHDAHMKFLDRHVDTTVFEKSKLAFYLRDFVNTMTLLIPMRDDSEKVRSIEDLTPFISKFTGSLYTMFPQNINEHQYIRIMRELITPYNPLYETYRDPSLDIRDHFTDNDSILEDVGRGIVKLGSSSSIKFDRQDGEVKVKKDSFAKRMKRRFFSDEKEKKYEPESSKKAKKIDDPFYVKVMSKKIFPGYADLHTITDLSMDYFNKNVQQQIPLPYVISLTVKIEDVPKVIDSVKQSSMWNKWQLDNVGSLAKYFPELQMRAAEADDVINVIDRYGDIPMKADWKILLYSQDIKELDYYSSIVKSNFQGKGFIIQEEDLIATNVFMYAMPMKYDEIYRKFSRRFHTIFKSNVSTIAPLGTDSRGFGQQPVVQLFGRNGQAQSFDLYDRNATNKNAVIVGPSGKGKTFFTQRIVWSYLRQGAKMRIIDSGHSYRQLCKQVGGQYITFPDNSGICLNPFTGARKDPQDKTLLHEDEVSNITNLIGVMAGYDLSETNNNQGVEIVNTLSSYISQAVKNAYTVLQQETGMKEVGEALRNILKHVRQNAKVEGDIRDSDVDVRLPGLISSLQEFTETTGIYFSYVNGPSNISFDKNLVVLDMDDLIAKQKKFKDFVIATVTNAVEREFYADRENTQRKLFLIDEAWQLLDGKAGATILGLYRRARKMRGSILTVTQSINDFHVNPNIRGIYENAYWRLFLEQDSSAMQTAKDEGKLVIDQYAFDLLGTVETKAGEYSEVMIMTEPGDLMIGRTLATRVEYWISTQDERDVNIALEVAKSFGITEGDARLAIGFSEMNKTSLDVEVTKLLGFEDEAVEELLAEEAV